MVIVFRVNNEWVSLCHLWRGDPLNKDIAAKIEESFPPSPVFLPQHVRSGLKFLKEAGFKRADPIELTFDENWNVIAVRKPGDENFLWRKP